VRTSERHSRRTDGPGKEGERLLIAVAAEPHEQRLLVKQRDAARERMHLEPYPERKIAPY
jgi:hypothetical protein